MYMLIFESLSYVVDVLFVISIHELDIALPTGSSLTLDF